MKYMRCIRHCEHQVNVYELRKGRKTRTLYVPDLAYMIELRRLNAALQHLPVHPAAHGFVPGRSVVTAAYQHVGYAHTSSFDLASFYDSLTVSHCKAAHLSNAVIERACIEGAPRQGLPTSPTVANLCAIWLDYSLTAMAERIGGSYTRYADDMTLSHPGTISDADLTDEVRRIVTHHGLVLNERKTHHQHARNGRRILCGVAVDDVSVYPPRRMKRRLRAARHQAERKRASANHARGLEQWCRCPIPAPKEQAFTGRLP